MLDVVQVMITIGLALAMVGGWYRLTLGIADVHAGVADAVDDAVKRQDDRIRKRIERADGTDDGQVLDVPGQANSVRPGVPLGR